MLIKENAEAVLDRHKDYMFAIERKESSHTVYARAAEGGKAVWLAEFDNYDEARSYLNEKACGIS